MTVRAGGHNTATLGTAIALHVQTEDEAIKKTRDKAMAPNLVMVAFQAGCGANPGKVLTLLKNLLELNGNKTYHGTSFVVWGVTPRRKRAVSSR